jgi:hypothetical protein
MGRNTKESVRNNPPVEIASQRAAKAGVVRRDDLEATLASGQP